MTTASLVYPNEKTLFMIALVISVLFWLGIILATKGIALLLLPVMFLLYLFVQSGFISYMKGTGALVSSAQFPDIQQRVKDCALKVNLRAQPHVYILHGNGVFNAFATRFLRKDYIILLSDVLDALEDNPDAINFYIGHEMGHIDRKHLLFQPLLSLGLILPLLGAAYSRAREYTCDRYGAACCPADAAQQGIALLAVGGKRYKTLSIREYLNQTKETSGFWMSFHELVGSYPWLVKRLARVSKKFPQKNMPKRNPFAYLLAIFVPRLDITSVIIIYFLAVGMSMGGVMKGMEMIENAEGIAAERSGEETSEGGMATGVMLTMMVEAVNKQSPQTIDEVTTLKGASKDGNDTLVYHYEISRPAEEIDPEQLKASVLSSSAEHWCLNPDTRTFRENSMKVVYSYKDNAGNTIGDILVDLGDPATCQQ